MQQNTKNYKSGFRNNYRADMPVTEAWLKDIRFAFMDMLRWISNGFKLPVIVAWPDFPSKKATIFKIAGQLGYRITNKVVKNPAAVLFFDDATFGSSLKIQKSYAGLRIFNQSCTDISKRHVDEIHKKVFGYNTIVDPLTYHGIAVQKSDINALHDGRIIQCPITVRNEKSIYQVLIMNDHDSEFVIDLRAPVINGLIPFIYKKFKKKEVRFTNDVSFSEMHSTDNHLSEEEQKQVISFCEEMGADFCELDILRNVKDGLIYIIDVNKTPYGPPFGLPEAQKNEAVKKLGECFLAMIR